MTALAASPGRSPTRGACQPLLRLCSDECLVRLVRGGNDAAFDVLLRRYRHRLLAFCGRMLNSAHDAEDVVQEVAAAAYRAMLADDRPIRMRPWLYRIARNEALDHLRRWRPRASASASEQHFADHAQTTADKAESRDAFRQLMADIARLPERQRSALLLREMEGVSHADLASVMQTTVPGIKSLLTRARVTLAEIAEARLLDCPAAQSEADSSSAGGRRSAGARRHLEACPRCRAGVGRKPAS